MKTPGHGAVAERACRRDAAGVIAITRDPLGGTTRSRPLASTTTRGCSASSGPKGWPSTVVRWLRRSSLRQSKAEFHPATLEHRHLQASLGKHLRRHAAAGTGAHNHHIHFGESHGLALPPSAHWRLGHAQHVPTGCIAIAAVARVSIEALHGVRHRQGEERSVLLFEVLEQRGLFAC